MRRLVYLASLTLSVTALVACSGPSNEAQTGSGEVAIRTAQCPTTFTLELDKPAIYAQTPTKYYDGSPLAAGEKARVESVMADAKKVEKQSFSFSLKDKANAKCSYVSTGSTAPSAPRAVLRGSSAKPMIDVGLGDFRYYAFPKAYDTSGFTFESNAKAGVFAQVGLSGPFSDGGSLIVKIGSAKISNAPSSPVAGGAIADAVTELESETVLPGPGRHDDYDVSGSTPLEMVKSYIKAKSDDDDDLVKGYTYQENARGLAMDEQVAGTLTNDVAVAQAMDSIKTWYAEDDKKEEHVTKAKAAFDKLVAAGAKFGFDGFEQNGCAAPTAFLLVIDTNAKHVYGVDLNPCSE